MKISKLLMPAVTLAGALALAGCGGGSSTPGAPDDNDGDKEYCYDGACYDTKAERDAAIQAAIDAGISAGTSGTPLTGDALADAKALQTGLGGFAGARSGGDGNLTVTGIQTGSSNSGKLGTPAKDDDDPWTSSSTVAPSVGGDWNAKGYTRTKDSGQESVVSYSTGDPFTSQLLTAWIAASSSDDNIPDFSPADGSVLTLPSGDTNEYNADFFPTGFHTQKRDDDGELKGTFLGLPGTFNCDDNACAVSRTVAGDSATITLTGTWTFDLDGTYASLRVPAKYAEAPNPEFLTFGYWWREAEDGEGDPEVTFDAFADGEVPRAALDGITGIVSASYSGKASGGYVREVLDGSKKSPAAAGQFTADVTLSAVFATSNTVQGSIHNFMDGSTPISDWKLTLQPVAAGDSTGAFTGTAGPRDGTGRYRGQFYGGAASDAPAGAAGVFNSGDAFSNGRAAGAFGATIDED